MELKDYYCMRCAWEVNQTKDSLEGITCPDCGGYSVLQRKPIEQADKAETKETVPLLTIVLDDINSVPSVHYKGEEITLKQRVSFDYKTNDDLGKYLTYIHIQRAVSQGNTELIQHNQPHDRDHD